MKTTNKKYLYLKAYVAEDGTHVPWECVRMTMPKADEFNAARARVCSKVRLILITL